MIQKASAQTTGRETAPRPPVGEIAGRALPEPGDLAGYAWLIDQYGLRTPLPRRLSALARRHHPASTADWLMLTPRHRPAPNLAGQLAFAFKWEGIDLGVLAALFRRVSAAEIAEIVQTTRTGAFARRLWFLYEWLTGTMLDVPGPGKVRAVPVLDPNLQCGLAVGLPSARHKVLDNLPGTPHFCPLVRRSAVLEAASACRYGERARAMVGRTRADIIARAASFLLLKDSKSSFAIEGERASGGRAARWARAIAQAGSQPLSLGEFERLQKVVIDDVRFVRLGLRQEGGFVGVHDQVTREPVPDHISARYQDLLDLMTGICDFDRRATPGGLDPVVAAASIGFGFVYVHPFEDGNGRLHRWLFHHVLAQAGFNPPGIAFPISSAIERQIEAYRAVLEIHSSAILALTEWRSTPAGNVEVLNDTADYYRYFDATAHAEFLYACVEQTAIHDLPDEVAFLERYDAFTVGVQHVADMPGRKVELLRGFLAQNGGRLSKRAVDGEFDGLSTGEVAAIEAVFKKTFGAGL